MRLRPFARRHQPVRVLLLVGLAWVVVNWLINWHRLAGSLKGASPPNETARPVDLLDLVIPVRNAAHIHTSQLFRSIPNEHQAQATSGGEAPLQFDYRAPNTSTHLDVVIIPHSHNDPGWLNTFEDYYQDKVVHILDNMLKYLDHYPEMRFVEAEISFFELWWSHKTDEERALLKKIVARKQLEFVGGAWVMTDEANANYYSTIMEIFEGHEFLKNNFDGYQPRSQWSIDPFGLSTTVPYLMQLAGVKQGVVNRLHHSIKDKMAQEQLFEFNWRQPFMGADQSRDFLCHVIPYLYFADYQCGPNRNICVHFDYYNYLIQITDQIVAGQAAELLSQLRLKAQFYRTDTVLLLEGHDFDYVMERQWIDTFENFNALAKHINANQNLYNATLRIGTAADYFEIMKKKMVAGQHRPIPTMTGDFFPYSEAMKHYWTGYFTSRPFYKHMDRSLAHYIRTADILFTLAHWKSFSKPTRDANFASTSYDLLVEARRWHALFQHHDAITGTARSPVVRDYGIKLEKALFNCKQVIEESLEYLTESTRPKLSEIPSNNQTLIQEVYDTPTTFLAFNPLARSVSKIVCIRTKTDTFIVNDETDTIVEQQNQPYIELETQNANKTELKINGFELCFQATEIPPLGSKVFKLVESTDSNKFKARITTAKKLTSPIPNFMFLTVNHSFSIAMDDQLLKFNATSGYLIEAKVNGKTLDLTLQFVQYFPSYKTDPKSGAYLFEPTNVSFPMPVAGNEYVVVSGAVRKQVIVKGPDDIKLLHRVVLDKGTPGFAIHNALDLHEHEGVEVAMHMHSAKLSTRSDQFFTDSNGFQFLRRERLHQLTLPAQYYPFTTAAFLQNTDVRLTAMTAQPLGIASLDLGLLEIMLERRTVADDGKGMEEHVHDNRCTSSEFHFDVEAVRDQPDEHVGTSASSLSAQAQHLSQQLLYPPVLASYSVVRAPLTPVAGLSGALPCDMHLVAMRTSSEATSYKTRKAKVVRKTPPMRQFGLILHRFNASADRDACVKEGDLQLNINDLFPDKPRQAFVTSLTGISALPDEDATNLQMRIMDLKTILVDF